MWKEVLMMVKRVSCREVGVDCDFVACAKTEDEVLRIGAEHARTHHNMTEISKEHQNKVRSAIRDAERC
jgi:predicted small metal-binding protein